MLKRLGALGLAVPFAGALGLACADEDAEATTATEGDTATAVAETTVSVVSTASATATQAPAQAVELDYLPNPEVPAPIDRSEAETVKVELETVDMQAKIADGAGYNYWAFNGTVPGPMIRVREGDTVELTLANRAGNSAGHNIDLHAVTGPGGGATLTNVAPGESKTFRFKALHRGMFIYHCATAPIPMHISAGMFGLIVVEPPEGLEPVDREFYICQSELYTPGRAGDPGLQSPDLDRMDAENPSYVVFNGAIGAIAGDRALKANVGEKVRVFFGVGGPNLTSSFHVIGEVFDRVATWGSFTSMAENVQTVTVAPGGATMVEFDVQVPGTYIIVDHALSRLTKGAAGHLVVEGDPDPEIFSQVE
jgi:nitrite reductase (NO-forming)